MVNGSATFNAMTFRIASNSGVAWSRVADASMLRPGVPGDYYRINPVVPVPNDLPFFEDKERRLVITNDGTASIRITSSSLITLRSNVTNEGERESLLFPPLPDGIKAPNCQVAFPQCWEVHGELDKIEVLNEPYYDNRKLAELGCALSGHTWFTAPLQTIFEFPFIAPPAISVSSGTINGRDYTLFVGEAFVSETRTLTVPLDTLCNYRFDVTLTRPSRIEVVDDEPIYPYTSRATIRVIQRIPSLVVASNAVVLGFDSPYPGFTAYLRPTDVQVHLPRAIPGTGVPRFTDIGDRAGQLVPEIPTPRTPDGFYFSPPGDSTFSVLGARFRFSQTTNDRPTDWNLTVPRIESFAWDYVTHRPNMVAASVVRPNGIHQFTLIGETATVENALDIIANNPFSESGLPPDSPFVFNATNADRVGYSIKFVARAMNQFNVGFRF
jgi:hypothetical protein